jgi:hypothetical protein
MSKQKGGKKRFEVEVGVFVQMKGKNLCRSLELTNTDMALIDKQFEILYLPKTGEDLLTDLTANADYLELDLFVTTFGGATVNLEAVSSIIAQDGTIPSQLVPTG